MRIRPNLAGVALAILMVPTAPAVSGTPYQEQVTCPVGGEKFEHTFTASYSTFGSRPDGKPYGSWIFPMPIPVCPSNKLPIYDEFSKDQVAKLEPLVASADFKEMASTNMPYFNAAWLMERTGETADKVAWMIVKASWEADDQPALKRRYQEDYVARITALPEGGDTIDWLFYQIRAANGLRELSRFDEAISLVDKLEPRAQAALVAAKAKQPADGEDADREAVESAEYLVSFLAKLKIVARERNPSTEPIDMLDTRTARMMCKDRSAELNTQDRTACARLPASDD